MIVTCIAFYIFIFYLLFFVIPQGKPKALAIDYSDDVGIESTFVRYYRADVLRLVFEFHK